MKARASDLIGPNLDWAVATAEGFGPGYMKNIDLRYNVSGKVTCMLVPINRGYVLWSPSTDWAQGGPIIEQKGISVEPWGSGDAYWMAQTYNEAGRVLQRQYGPTPLIAAMRCYVASKLGDEIEIPEELT